MDAKSLTFSAVVVAAFVLGSAGLVGAALLIARTLLLDRFFKQWGSVGRADGGARTGWSSLGPVLNALGIVAMLIALSAILGSVQPGQMLASPWALGVCAVVLLGFMGIAIGTSPRRSNIEARDAQTGNGETIARIGSDAPAPARRAA